MSNLRINRNARLIIRNISFKVTEESLKEHFQAYGEIQEVKLLKKPDGKLVGCAFVQFKNVPMAKKALLNTNMKPFLGRPISVDWAVPKNVYMRHVDEQNQELQDKVKKEEPDSDNEDNFDITGDSVKPEVKSEVDEDSDDEEKEDQISDDEESSEDDDGDEGEEKFDTSHEKKSVPDDAEDGNTVFMTNIPFTVDKDQLRTFVELTGPVRYAVVCIDRLTEHSRGSGFVKFVNKEDADKFLALGPDQLKIEGQVVQAKPALKRDSLQRLKTGKREPKDNRNLYLVKEGVVVAGTKAAVGLSASDMAKRLTLEKNKTQMLRNLNRFVSRYRLVVSNLPPHYDDGALRATCVRASPAGATITEARVMRDLRSSAMPNGKHPSKGFGFVMFTRHEDAVACLRRLNNNPEVFDQKNRPIVSFSIEDRTALNARKKRLEKSIANNPLANNSYNAASEGKRQNRKRKNQTPDESTVKTSRFENKISTNAESGYGRFVKIHNEEEKYTGLTAKEGDQHKMRNSHKLKMQANLHRQNVKLEKKKSGRTLKLKRATKERIKQPKQKINKKPKDKKIKTKAAKVPTENFSSLVSNYKSKLAGKCLDRIKSKWYDN